MAGHDLLTFTDSIDIILTRLDGSISSLKLAGIGVRDFVISSPKYQNKYEEVEGRNGSVDIGTIIGNRQIKADLYFIAHDMLDYALKRDEVFALFDSRESFYISESRNPGKRWLVKVDGAFTPDQSRTLGFFSITFNSASPFAESIGTTLDPFTFDAELWQIGQGLITDELIYVHNTPSFQIYNAGNVDINPRYLPLKISYKGASTDLKIKNVTTRDEWAHTGISNAGDIILLDGIRSTKNGMSVFRNTNKKLITLKPGWNDFELTGTSGSFKIIFDFRFYYL